MHPYLQFYELSIRIYYNITCVLASHMIPSSLNAASKARETSPGGRVTRVFFMGHSRLPTPLNATPEPQEIRPYTPYYGI